jgi:Matrixin
MLPSIRSCYASTVVAFIVLTGFSGEPAAYVLSGPKWPQPQTPYYVNSTNLDMPGAIADAAVRAGAETWVLQASAFRFLYAGPSSQTTNTYDGINLVMFRSDSSGSAIATSYWWHDGSRMLDADIVFWDGSFRFFAGSSGCSGGFYIEDIAAHEFGHALGLGHSTSPTATMYPSAFTCDSSVRVLDADDISGVRALYPPGLPPQPPTGLRIVR